MGRTWEFPPEAWDDIMAGKLRGAFLGFKRKLTAIFSADVVWDVLIVGTIVRLFVVYIWEKYSPLSYIRIVHSS